MNPLTFHPMAKKSRDSLFVGCDTHSLTSPESMTASVGGGQYLFLQVGYSILVQYHVSAGARPRLTNLSGFITRPKTRIDENSRVTA